MGTFTIERRVEIAAGIADVWQAVSDPQRLIAWLAPAMPNAGVCEDDCGRATGRLGPMALDFLAHDAAEPPRRLSVRNAPDETATVTFTLAEERASTRVAVVAAGALPPGDTAADRLGLSGFGWEVALRNLVAYVEGASLPVPLAATAPLFGYWRQLGDEYAVERGIHVDAPRAAVWDALVDPGRIQAWFSPPTRWQRSALEVGGRLFVRNEGTGAEMDVEIIGALDPHDRFGTYCVPKTAGVPLRVKRYTLVDDGPGTRLTLTCSGYRARVDGMHWAEMEQTTYEYGMMLQNLKAHIEGAPLPHPFGFRATGPAGRGGGARNREKSQMQSEVLT